MAIRIKRIYEPAGPSDGFRVLVDRLWPRGVSKDKARIDLWLRDVAPSPALRVWFGHDPERWTEFRARYHAELRRNSTALAPLVERAKKGRLTLLYSARDERFNQAVALKVYLDKQPRPRRSTAKRGKS
jgi:uncharacterized protein YeaO (DUF488 family)